MVDPRRLLEVFPRIVVLHVVPWYTELELGAVVLHVVVVRQLLVHLRTDEHARLVRPGACNIPDCVAPTAKNDEREIERLDERDAVRVTCFESAVFPE